MTRRAITTTLVSVLDRMSEPLSIFWKYVALVGPVVVMGTPIGAAMPRSSRRAF